MVEAYVLIQTELARPGPVAAAVNRIPGVSGAAVVIGQYDVIVRMEAADVDSLAKLVVSEVQAVEGVTRTLTCPIIHF